MWCATWQQVTQGASLVCLLLLGGRVCVETLLSSLVKHGSWRLGDKTPAAAAPTLVGLIVFGDAVVFSQADQLGNFSAPSLEKKSRK